MEYEGALFDTVCYRLVQVTGYNVKIAGVQGEREMSLQPLNARDLGVEQGERQNHEMMKKWPAEKKREHALMMKAYGKDPQIK